MAVDIIARGIAGAAQVGLAQANERIDRLEGKTTRLLYTASTDPTAADINSFVEGLGYTSPFEGIGVVIAGTYHIWHYYENDSIGWRDDGVDTITLFTNSLPGSILGSVDDGKVTANNDGTGSVNGWNDKLNSIAAALAYDNTKAYTIDEICTYNGHLYICIQNTTAGTLPIDTTYWEEISVIQLINEFKLALRDGSFIVEKANNSNSSLSTKAIDPISDESGTIHEVPFISQGTGTANNTASVDTSPVAKQLEKQGYTVVSNQLVPTTAISTETKNSVTCTNNNDGSYTLSGTATDSTASFVSIGTYAFVYGRKYLLIGCPSGGSADSYRLVVWDNGSNMSNFRDFGSGTIAYKTNPGTFTGNIAIQASVGVNVTGKVFKPRIVDLTQHFNGNSNIPQDLLDNPSHWSWYDNGTGAYDAGTLKNGNGRYLVCTERQLFNPATVVSGQLGVDGTISSSSSYKTSDYILIVPNRTYYIEKTNSSRIKFYDKDKQPLRTDAYDVSISGSAASTFTASANAIYARFTMSNSLVDNTGLTLYYTPEQGGEGYDQHYDYVEPNVYDTGTEELLAFDTKDPDGTIHRNTGSVDLSTLNWTYSVNDNFFASDDLVGLIKQPSSENIKVNAVTGKYVVMSYLEWIVNRPNMSLYCSTAGKLRLKTDGTSTITPTGTLQYELATPTTEQGTSFPENISVNDYGMMYWLDTDGNLVSIPQGCKLFYPVDYVLYLDTLVSHTEGDATSLVRWSDMATQSEIDEILDLI